MTYDGEGPHGNDIGGQAPRIAVGVDGSEPSIEALDWATSEARLRGAVLEILHVDFFRHEALEAFAPDMLATEKSILDKAMIRAHSLAPEVLVTGRILDPPAGKALIAASQGADLLVVGSRGLSGLKEIALGSVSNECAHHARCPVVIIRPSVDHQAGELAGGAARASEVGAGGGSMGGAP